MDNSLAAQFSKSLFWDTDQSQVDLEKHAACLIEKVVTRGDMKDWELLKSIYGIDTIKNTCVKLKYLDPKTHHSLANIFDIPKENFRCYTERQLNKGLWIY